MRFLLDKYVSKPLSRAPIRALSYLLQCHVVVGGVDRHGIIAFTMAENAICWGLAASPRAARVGEGCYGPQGRWKWYAEWVLVACRFNLLPSYAVCLVFRWVGRQRQRARYRCLQRARGMY